MIIIEVYYIFKCKITTGFFKSERPKFCFFKGIFLYTQVNTDRRTGYKIFYIILWRGIRYTYV